ncbi:MAG: transcription elongation factor NusA [Hadesarchaea archaeon YNP_N21]|nr:MAG: transcription elongation factor NusA [Hadesarchaea archaeon YNP_N21]
MSIKFGADEMRCIALFESLTGATVKDCILGDDGRVIFVVRQGDLGLAIGKGGSRIRHAKKAIGRSIEVVEYSDDPATFLKNLLAPAKVRGVNIVTQGGKKIAVVDVEEQDRGLAVGRKGKNIHRAKILMLRHHGIHDVTLM